MFDLFCITVILLTDQLLSEFFFRVFKQNRHFRSFWQCLTLNLPSAIVVLVTKTYFWQSKTTFSDIKQSVCVIAAHP